MRLLELEIHNMRGIRHVVLEPDGDNFVIWGPNGAGKSAVVDALDFLLTGRISRLTGRGTSGITLNHHGPHIDRKPKDARVRAKIKISGIPDPVEIERCMANADMLVCQKSVRPQVERIMDVAQRGQHVLTRREILKFITTVPSTRGRQIQQILDLTEIEGIRKALVRVHNQASREYKAAKEQLEAAKSTVAATIQAEEFTRRAVLTVVNRNRAILSAKPVSALHSSKLKDGLTMPALQVEHAPQSINLTILERDIQHLRSKLSEAKQAAIASTDQQLRQLLSAIRSQPELLRALTRRQLTEIGLRLMDESGSCPLCDTPWPAGELHRYLEQQLSMADEAAQNQKRIEELSGGLLDAANNTLASVSKVTRAAEIVANADDVQLLKSWLSHLQRFTEALSVPLEKYPRPYFPTQQVQRMLAPIALEETLERTYGACKDRFRDTPPEQTAWDTLTRLEENLKVLE